VQRISDNALDVLRQCITDSDLNTVTIPTSVGTLDRKLYEEVDVVLSAIGGKWNRSKKAHLYPYNPAPLLGGVIASGIQPNRNPTAFFPTPASVVKIMVEEGGIFEGCRILEPSAGTGAICKAVRDYAAEIGIDVTVHCCEVLDVNRAALQAQGFEIVAEDFMKYEPDEPYDCVLMNPPFSLPGDTTAYATHIEHAWSLLCDFGKLVAITPAGWLYGSTKRLTAFRDWACDNMSYEELGSGTFKDSGTMVNTILMYGEKEPLPWRTKPYNGWPSYHAWHAGLWMDNDRETYEKRVGQVKCREQFVELCREVERQMVQREHCPCLLHDEDIDALWRHYQDESI
jgi:hypothetical protein